MKKVKESGKLDINKRLTNHSARKYLLQQIRKTMWRGHIICKYQGIHMWNQSLATPKRIEMLWYQLSSTYLVQLQHPQIIQPVALLMFRVEVIPMFLPTNMSREISSTCMFTEQSSMSTHWMCTQIPITNHEKCIYELKLVFRTSWIAGGKIH